MILKNDANTVKVVWRFVVTAVVNMGVSLECKADKERTECEFGVYES